MYKQFEVVVFVGKTAKTMLVTALSHIQAQAIVRKYGYVCA